MNQELKSVGNHMRKLGLGALSHAIWHAACMSFENEMWNELSVLQAAHAAEILIKSRIADEHPLLLFEQLPKQTPDEQELGFKQLTEQGRTYQYFDLPNRLWATTTITLPNLQAYNNFGKLRNSIQHFAHPTHKDLGGETLEFIFSVIDPFINECWDLYAIDYNEDHEPYEYLLPVLIAREIRFLISPNLLEFLESFDQGYLKWPKGSSYSKEMKKRISKAGQQ